MREGKSISRHSFGTHEVHLNFNSVAIEDMVSYLLFDSQVRYIHTYMPMQGRLGQQASMPCAPPRGTSAL